MSPRVQSIFRTKLRQLIGNRYFYLDRDELNQFVRLLRGLKEQRAIFVEFHSQLGRLSNHREIATTDKEYLDQMLKETKADSANPYDDD